MEEVKKFFRFEIVVYLIGVAFAGAIWYSQNNSLNQIQSTKLSEHDSRLAALEQKQNMNDTQMAVIQVQLQAIQADLKDIKEVLKKK